MLPGYKIDRAYSKVDRSRHATCTILADISMPKLFQGVQQHQHEPTKSPWSYIWAHHLSHAAPGRRRPRNQSSPTRYLLVGAMYSKCASGKVIKYILPGGRMHDNHWLLRNWIKLKDLQQRHRKFSLQIWCKKFTGIYTWDGCAIYGKNILRQRRQSGQPMHTSSYRGLMLLSSEFSWRSDFPDHIFILQVSTSSTSSV